MSETAKVVRAEADEVENHSLFTRHLLPEMSMCILRGLGCGTHGTVYLAEECATRWDCDSDSVPPKQYAMKVIEKKLNDRAHVHTREYKYHTRVASHPNILQPHSMLETKDAVILTSEYIKDGTFGRFLFKYGHFLCCDNVLIRTIFLQLLDAVAHMHEQGVYHGDLKPENILCKHDEDRSRLLIADFGTCTDRPYIYHQNGYSKGTKGYNSPECFPGPTGGRCVFPHAVDIWSLGTILFIMCTNHYPWKHAHPKDPYYQLFIADPNYFFSRWRLTGSAKELLKTIWQPQPESRVNIYQLREMVEAMTNFTTYADSSTVMVCGKRHTVLHTHFWLAGRCGLPREIHMPQQWGSLEMQQAAAKVKPPPSSQVAKIFAFHEVATYVQKSKLRINQKPKPSPIITTVPTPVPHSTSQIQLSALNVKLPVELREAALHLLDGSPI